MLVEGDRITWVGQASDAKIPPDATVIDTSGRVMMPGLIDLHVHLKNIGHGSYDRWDPWIMERNLLEKVNAISARQLLMAGRHDGRRSRRADAGDPDDARSHRQG